MNMKNVVLLSFALLFVVPAIAEEKTNPENTNACWYSGWFKNEEVKPEPKKEVKPESIVQKTKAAAFAGAKKTKDGALKAAGLVAFLAAYPAVKYMAAYNAYPKTTILSTLSVAAVLAYLVKTVYFDEEELDCAFGFNCPKTK